MTSQKTLVDELMDVEKLPSHLSVNKVELYKEIFENLRGKIGLLERAIKKEISLPQDFDSLCNRIYGVKLWYPNTPSEKDLRSAKEYFKLIGYHHPQSGNVIGSVIDNPVGMAAFTSVSFGGLMKVANLGEQKEEQKEYVRRREFLHYFGCGALLGGLFGSAIAVSGNSGEIRGKRHIKYIDDKLREAGLI